MRGHEGPVNTVAISYDSHWLVTGSVDNTARVWDLTAKDAGASPVILLGHDGVVDALAISPDNRWLASRDGGETVRLWLLQMKGLIDLARGTVDPEFSIEGALFSRREVPQDVSRFTWVRLETPKAI